MNRKKSLNFDLNVISFIGLLAVCICFLLLAAIWVHIASIDVRQTLGESSFEDQESSVIWAKMLQNGQVELILQNPPSNIDERLHSHRVQGLLNAEGLFKPNYEDILSHLRTIMTQVPYLSTGLVIPYRQAKYEDIILIMDQFKEVGLSSLGVSPI